MAMQWKHIDTHSHPHFPQFDGDREAVLAQMREAGVATIAVGTDYETSARAVALASDERARDVVLGVTVGVHPTDAQKGFLEEQYAPLLESGIVVGVGECGFDYFRAPRDEVHDTQRAVFEAQVRFALAHDLPLMLHVRPSKGSDDAHEDALALLARFKDEHGERLRGTAHFFTGSAEVALRYVALGFHVSFPGVITFAPETHEAVRAVPVERILSETDAPYAAPVPHRGRRNEPAFVVDTIRAIANVRDEEYARVAARLAQNAKTLFFGDS